MDRPIVEILRHQRHKNIDLLLLPPQAPRQQRQAEALQALEAVDAVPAAQLLHEGVLGPRVLRPHEHALLHVDEARGLHPGDVVVADVGAHGAAHLAARFAEQRAPFVDVGAGVRAVFGAHGEPVVLEFEPAAGFEVAVCGVSGGG